MIAVVKVGARTAVGLDARQTGFLLRAGLPVMSEAPLSDDAGVFVELGICGITGSPGFMNKNG